VCVSPWRTLDAMQKALGREHDVVHPTAGGGHGHTDADAGERRTGAPRGRGRMRMRKGYSGGARAGAGAMALQPPHGRPQRTTTTTDMALRCTALHCTAPWRMPQAALPRRLLAQRRTMFRTSCGLLRPSPLAAGAQWLAARVGRTASTSMQSVADAHAAATTPPRHIGPLRAASCCPRHDDDERARQPPS
jgi:hypothetical protein